MKPLRYSQQSIDDSDIAAVVATLRSDWLTQGPEVERFEQSLCAYVGSKYAVAVSSGTAALQLAYLAARTKLGFFGEHEFCHVLTSPLSFVATTNAILLAGNEPAFYDVDWATGNLICRDDPPYEFVVPVHYAGRAVQIPGKATVIEDACHALGAMDFDGCSRVGSCAHSLATCFSFHPVKPITTGEGGAVTTNDQGFADEVRLLRSHGRDASGQMVTLGMNYRLTDIQAALGTSQLERCDEMRERRELLSLRYHTGLEALEVDGRLTRPGQGGNPFSNAWHLYPVRIKNGNRDAVKAMLNAQGIGAQVHYPCIHLQPYYRERYGYHEGMFPEAEAWSDQELSLPLHAGMTEADVTRVVDALRKELSA